MTGLDGTTTQANANESLRANDGTHPLESETDYRIAHESPATVHEFADRSLEGSAYESHGYKGEELREFRAQHEGEFTEVQSRSYPVERFGNPDDVVRSVNPFYGDRSRSFDVNCADCARSVERTWRGNHEEAAGRLPQLDAIGRIEPRGEPSATTEEWAGEQFQPVSDRDEFRQTLLDGGHGSSAIVHSTWEQGSRQMAGGHAYNLVNFHGELRVLDGQSGENLDWVPGDIHPEIGWNPEHQAMAWDAKGERIW